ncbi:hypothetical protein OAO87_03350 [bacterium]|nr:hypothetical protein [bacterium]
MAQAPLANSTSHVALLCPECRDGTTLFVADFNNHRIRKIIIATGVVTTLAGSSNGFLDGSSAKFYQPGGVDVSLDGTTLFVADERNHRIRAIVISTGVVSTLAGSGDANFFDSTGTAAKFKYPRDVTVSHDGTVLYVADAVNNRIRQLVISTAAVTTIAGSGDSDFFDATGTAAKFSTPWGLEMSADGTTLFVADAGNHRIRQILPPPSSPPSSPPISPPAPPAPPMSPPPPPLTGLYLSAPDAKLHFGPSMECTLEFKSGPPPYLESTCPIAAPPPAPAPE